LLFKEVLACSGVASLRDDFTHPIPKGESYTYSNNKLYHDPDSPVTLR
jgi:hypothetical protein